MSEDVMNPVKNAVRMFNKYALNPAMMHLTGRKHWYASVIRHTTRRSGKSYATPVVADQVAGGLGVSLRCGTGVDWLRNVMTAGSATIVARRNAYDVLEPEIIDAPAPDPLLSGHRRRAFARFGVENFVKFGTA
jgi:hypothetical protein